MPRACLARWARWAVLCEKFAVGNVCYALIGAAIPLMISGGFHVDGYMDTMDAFHSYQSREKKLEILKDSHIGAFAAIMLALYYMIDIAAISEIHTQKAVSALAAAVLAEVKRAIAGKDACITKAFATILAGGHILIEDVPGVGKTTLAIAFSRVMGLLDHRVQFTPDVLPADIVGFNMYQKETGQFVYHPGTIMCNLFLADEINRTSPKTQSALLEVMEEGKVTVDGVSRKVPQPFVVIATQNPKGSAGTQLLPESQLDRFMTCMSMGYPDLQSEMEIAQGKTMTKAEDLQPVLLPEQLWEMQQYVEQIYVHDNVAKYIVQLMEATRKNAYIELGVSPRGTIACVRLAKAWAFLQGRNYVIPDDVTDIFADVAKHRIVLNTKARIGHVTVDATLQEILSDVDKPTTYKRLRG